VTAFFVFNSKNINIWKGFIEMENNSIQKRGQFFDKTLHKAGLATKNSAS